MAEISRKDGITRTPLAPPSHGESQASFTGRRGLSPNSGTRLPTDSGASFDELVYQFTTNSKTLSSQERLAFLKQSKASLERIEGSNLRTTLDQTQRARERAQASRATPRPTQPSPTPSPPPTAGRSGKRDSLSTNAPLTKVNTQRPKGPFLLLDEEVVREEQLKKHGHYVVQESPTQIYSVRGEGAIHTPQKVSLGTEERPTVLNDFFPEPVRNRQRRRGSYANYRPTPVAVAGGADTVDGDGLQPLPPQAGEPLKSPTATSARSGTLGTPRGSAMPTSRRASIIVLAIHTPKHGPVSSAPPFVAQKTPFSADRVSSGRPSATLQSPVSGRQRGASTIVDDPLSGHATRLTSPTTHSGHPFAFHTRVSSHLSASGQSTTAATTTATTSVAPAPTVRSRSAGAHRRRGSFQTRARAHTPQTRGTFSRNTTPPPVDSAQPTPVSPLLQPSPVAASSATPLPQSSKPRRSRRGSKMTPRRASMLSGRSLQPELSPGESHAHGRTSSANSNTGAAVPPLDVLDLRPLTPGTRRQSLIKSPHRAENSPRSPSTPRVSTQLAAQGTSDPSPRAGARTARTRHLYQAQRAAILDLLNAEIRSMQGPTGSPADGQDAAGGNAGNKKITTTSSKGQRRGSTVASSAPGSRAGSGPNASKSPASPQEASAPRENSAPPLSPEPIRVDDVAPYPDVAHALTLLAGNGSSPYNWVMLAEAMSEAQLLPPCQVRVVYKPDMESNINSAVAASVAVDDQGTVARWMTMTDALVEALNIDNEMKNAWEGLALLLAPDEKVVVRKARTGRPITVNNVLCYVQLLRIEPTYFYGWMGLGCAMVEEQKNVVEEARLAEAQTKAMETMAEEEEAAAAQQRHAQTVHGPLDTNTFNHTDGGNGAFDGGATLPASTPPASYARRGRRDPAMTLDDGLRLLEEEERNAQRSATASRIKPGRQAATTADGGSSAAGAAPASSPHIPAVTHDVLFGMRPFEAKDCFAHAAQLCPWEGSIWLQILMGLPDATATVEFDAPTDEREWADALQQRSTMEVLGGGALTGLPDSDGNASATPEAAAQKVALHRKMIALDDERLLKGCTLTFAEVAGIALELNEDNKDVWRYVGARLAPSDSDGSRTPKMRTTITSAGVFVTALNGSVGGQSKRTRRGSVKGGATASSASKTTTVTVFDKPYTREQCFQRARELGGRGAAKSATR